MLSMSQNNGVVTTFRGEIIFEFKNSPQNDETNVHGLNNAPHMLVKPLVVIILFPIHGSYTPFVLNPNFNLGV